MIFISFLRNVILLSLHCTALYCAASARNAKNDCTKTSCRCAAASWQSLRFFIPCWMQLTKNVHAARFLCITMSQASPPSFTECWKENHSVRRKQFCSLSNRISDTRWHPFWNFLPALIHVWIGRVKRIENRQNSVPYCSRRSNLVYQLKQKRSIEKKNDMNHQSELNRQTIGRTKIKPQNNHKSTIYYCNMYFLSLRLLNTQFIINFNNIGHISTMYFISKFCFFFSGGSHYALCILATAKPIQSVRRANVSVTVRKTFYTSATHTYKQSKKKRWTAFDRRNLEEKRKKNGKKKLAATVGIAKFVLVNDLNHFFISLSLLAMKWNKTIRLMKIRKNHTHTHTHDDDRGNIKQPKIHIVTN